MAHDTNYEIYEIRAGQWRLVARFSTLDEAAARERAAAHFAAENAPCLLIEETAQIGAEPKIRVIWGSAGSSAQARAPDAGSDLIARGFMVAGGGVAVGAIGAVLSAVLMTAARGSVLGPVVAIAFLAAALAGMLVLFRVVVPIEFLLWRNKSEATRRKVAQVLLHGGGTDDAEAEPSAATARPRTDMADRYARPARTAPAPPPTAPPENHAGDILTPAGDVGAAEATPGTPAAAASILEDFIAAERDKLLQFAAAALTELAPYFPTLPSFARFGFNLYLAGANQTLIERDTLTPATAREVLSGVLAATGVDATSAAAFCDRVDSYAGRPRYKHMLEAGRAAMAARLDGQPTPVDAAVVDAMRFWTMPNDKAAAAQQLTVLLTDMVGSTAVTGQIGNSGAQRLVRTHNSVVRAAIKAGRGAELKHTGDGILATFADPIAAVAAATEIQQEIAGWVRDNPDMPLALRIGVHRGDVVVDDGEPFGDALAVIDDICARGAAGEIVCSRAVHDKTAGGIYKYAVLAAADGAEPLYRLLWEPKRVYGKGAVEYRHIGAKPKAGDGDAA
ncbi:MAG: adenylate/guanylate cyclase domain-containing protein [Rhodospirillaceae bacterium]|nr:adenylate/guanylate cyclase domain-containing protein [Rhodospirillaceae bacterium]